MDRPQYPDWSRPLKSKKSPANWTTGNSWVARAVAGLVQNDIEDPLFTLPEIYRKAGAPGRYRCTFYPGPHKFDRAMQTEAFAWFDRWLTKAVSLSGKNDE